MAEPLSATAVALLFAGAALGQLFAALYDAVKEANGGSMMEFKPLKNLQATLQTLKPLMIQKIGEHNKELCLPNDVVEVLKRQMQEGVVLVRKLSSFRKLKVFLKPRYIDQLCELDESLKRLILELKIQEIRDVKEVLLLAREHVKKLEELRESNMEVLELLKAGNQQDSEEDVNDTLALATIKTKQYARLTGSVQRLLSTPAVQEKANDVEVQVSVKDITTRLELVQTKVDSEEDSLLKYAALANAFLDLSDAVFEVNQQTRKYRVSLRYYETPLKNLIPVIENVAKRSKKLKAAEVELENLIVQMEEGVKLVRGCLTNSINPFCPLKLIKHGMQLVENSRRLQSMINPIYVALLQNT